MQHCNTSPTGLQCGDMARAVMEMMKNQMENMMDRWYRQIMPFMPNVRAEVRTNVPWASQMMQMMMSPLKDVTPMSSNYTSPNCDVYECGSHYHIVCEMPGVKKENAKANISESMLVISGDRDESEMKNLDQIVMGERKRGNFKRCFSLPQDINEQEIKVEFNDGLMCVTIPKTGKNAEEQPPRELEIQ